MDHEKGSPFFRVIVHSFFVIPFLIAVFCLLLFTAIHLLTSEKRTVYDYLEDVKTGGLTKRWQAAFELSKILANPDLIPGDERFTHELINAFEQARDDDPRVRQYLALAMGRTGHAEFLNPLLKGLQDEKEENLPAVIYALGMLGHKGAASRLYAYMEHPLARIRSITVAALGNLADPDSKDIIRKGLADSEPNVQWGAAVALAHMGDAAGKDILRRMLNREYLSNFSEVDAHEQDNLVIMAIEAAARLEDPLLNDQIRQLSQTDQNMKVRAAALRTVSTGE